MASTAATYRDAAKEHLGRADELFAIGSYYLAHYIAGLAVECHLRAYLMRKTDEWDPNHDIGYLARKSGFYDIVSAKRSAALSANIATVNSRWRSNQRYSSDRQFLDYMNQIKAEFNKPGERWKNLARTLQNAAHEVINEGELRW